MNKAFTLFSLKKRILAVLLVISFVFCSLVCRLFVLQIINGKQLQSRATDQWTRDLAIVAPRGTIYDRTGSALAVSYTTYNVYVRAREVKESSTTALHLSEILGLNFESVYSKIVKKNASEVLIKMQVEGEDAEKIYRLGLPGVYLAENSNRYYTYGNLLTQVLGFISIDNVGQTGIEAYYNDLLKGKDGFSYVQSDLQGKEIGGSLRYYVAGEAGKDLTLTIDSKMQLILEQALEKIMLEQKAKAATGMILNAKSGEILSLSSKPSFDLNEVPRDDLTALFEQSKVKAATDIYEPGSTFKILTVAAALEEGLTNLNDRFYCPGFRVIDGIRIKCWRTIGHGSQNLMEAFANSCNCCFMDLALRLGVDKFYSYMNKFGLGQKTGIDATGEASGILMAKKLVKNVDLARMGFGHAVALTPLQLLSGVSAIVNGGTFNSPHLLVEGSSARGLRKVDDIIGRQTSQTVNALLEFAENKTGKYTFVEGYNVGGKTGTAQKYKETGGIDSGKYISSFIGTYPADNPQYIVFIMVDEPSNGAYYGSIVAAPYGKEVFYNLFDYLGEEKQDENARTEYVEMPYLVGKSLTECATILKEMGLYFELDGEGEFIAQQLPPVSTQIAKGSTILLVTD
ncbi:MAG: PASTA domain-containing protein [Clostridia bacterium]|nr:PASTA domain-containing protein [Clostridia bacterium]